MTFAPFVVHANVTVNGSALTTQWAVGSGARAERDHGLVGYVWDTCGEAGRLAGGCPTGSPFDAVGDLSGL